MIRNVWSVLCRDIITDQETNSVTYVRCIEEGLANELPVKIGPIFLGTLWEKEGEESESVQFRVILAAPDKTARGILKTKPMPLDKPRHRLHFRINTMEVSSFGLHHVVVEYVQDDKWNRAAMIPILIRQVQPKST